MPCLPRTSRAALAVAALLAAGCAARGAPGTAPDIRAANRLLESGCYTCLVDALALYDALLQRKPTPAARRGAFRTSLLLALREKELGLPASPYLDRAKHFGGGLPPQEHAALFLEIATGLPWDSAGLSAEARDGFFFSSRPHGPRVEAWRAKLEPLLADPLAAYLDVSLVCRYLYGRDGPALSPQLSVHDRAPLIAYAVGSCSRRHGERLAGLVASDPRYVEARFFLGRNILTNAATGSGAAAAALPDLTAAYEAFPKSPSVTFAMAGLYRAVRKLPEALRYYDETLALVPGHREALLGRTIALSYLARHPEGVLSATRILELGTWYVGDAYYWRAYNHKGSADLDRARDDIELAKEKQPLSSDTFTLAGMIYLDRKELATAAADLLKALELDGANCMALWYLGLVRSEQQDWRDAAGIFDRSGTCYSETVAQLRAEARVLAEKLADAREREQVEKDYALMIDENFAAEGRSWYNAAYASARLGDIPRATSFAERALPHVALKAKAQELITALKK